MTLQELQERLRTRLHVVVERLPLPDFPSFWLSIEIWPEGPGCWCLLNYESSATCVLPGSELAWPLRRAFYPTPGECVAALESFLDRPLRDWSVPAVLETPARVNLRSADYTQVARRLIDALTADKLPGPVGDYVWTGGYPHLPDGGSSPRM